MAQSDFNEVQVIANVSHLASRGERSSGHRSLNCDSLRTEGFRQGCTSHHLSRSAAICTLPALVTPEKNASREVQVTTRHTQSFNTSAVNERPFSSAVLCETLHRFKTTPTTDDNQTCTGMPSSPAFQRSQQVWQSKPLLPVASSYHGMHSRIHSHHSCWLFPKRAAFCEL